MQVLIREGDFHAACAGDLAPTDGFAGLQRFQKHIPLQPAAFKKAAYGRRGLQRQAHDLFGLLVVVPAKKRVAVQGAAQLVDGLGVLLRQARQLQVDPAVALAVGESHAVDQLAEQVQAVAQQARGVVKKAGRVDLGVVERGVDLAAGKPRLQRQVLLCGGEVGRVLGVHVRELGTCARCGGGSLRGSALVSRLVVVRRAQGLQFAHGGGVALYQFFDEEHRAVHGAGAAAAAAGRGLADRCGCVF